MNPASSSAPQTASRSPRRTQQERTAESTRRLLAAAVELMAEKGFERTTAMEIGERAGYSRSMVRSRYGSKEGLLESLLREEFEPLMLTVEEDVDFAGGRTGLARAVALLSRTCVVAEEEPALLRAFFIVCFETVGPGGRLTEWLSDWLIRYEAEMAAALRAGIADESVKHRLDPELEAQRVVAVGLGIGFRWVLDPSRNFVEEMRAWIERVTAEYRSGGTMAPDGAPG